MVDITRGDITQWPCIYNTFDGRLLGFDDGVEGKRGLTLTGFFGGAGGGKLFHCVVCTGVYGILCA